MAEVDFDRLVAGFRAAKDQGNTELAKKLAVQIKALEGSQSAPAAAPPPPAQETQPTEQPATTSNEFMGMLNSLARTGSDLAGGFRDLRNWRREALPLPWDGQLPGADAHTDVASGLETVEQALPDYQSENAGSIRKAITGEDLSLGNLAGAVQEGVGTIASELPTMAMATNPLGLAALAAANTQRLSKEAAANDGRDERTPEDLLRGLGGGVASAALERVGARGVLGPGTNAGRGIVAGARRTGGALVREAGTEGAQQVAEDVATQLGTERGYDPQEGLLNAAEAAVIGGIGGAGIRGGREITTGTASALRRNLEQRGFNAELAKDPETFMSQLRMLEAYETEKSQLQKSMAGSAGEIEPLIVFKNLRDSYSTKLEDYARELEKSGAISKDQHRALNEARHGMIAQADNTQRVLNRERVLNELETFTSLEPDQKQLLRDALIDLDLASHSSVGRRAVGPLERGLKATLGRERTARILAGGGAGALTGSLPVAIAGSTVAAAAPYIGRAIDRRFGLNQPMALSRARARRDFADARGLDTETTASQIDRDQAEMFRKRYDAEQRLRDARGLMAKNGGLRPRTPGGNRTAMRLDEAIAKSREVTDKPFYFPPSRDVGPRMQEVTAKLDELRGDGALPDRVAGWKQSMVDFAREKRNVAMEPQDVDAAVNFLVDQGVFTREEADVGLMGGANVNEAANSRLFKEIANLAEEQAKQRIAQQSVTRKAEAEARRANRTHEEVEAARLRAQKAAETRRRNREQAEAQRARAPGQLSSTRVEGASPNEASRLSTIAMAQQAMQVAIDSAPNAKAKAGVIALANTKTRSGKQAKLEDLLEALGPKHRRWIKEVVEPLTDYGPRGS